MIRRQSGLMALVAAAMIGIADATGLAPPMPILIEDEVHWLAPGEDDDRPIFTLISADRLAVKETDPEDV